MVYGAFPELVMRRSYEELLKSPLGECNLVDSAMEICAGLDRLLVEKIWPVKEKRHKQRQEKEASRLNENTGGRLQDGRQTRALGQ